MAGPIYAPSGGCNKNLLLTRLNHHCQRPYSVAAPWEEEEEENEDEEIC